MDYVSSFYHERSSDFDAKYRQPDLSHHLSAYARALLLSPMKSIWRVAQAKTGSINMGNGDPHHTLYPFCEMSFVVPSVKGQEPVLAWRAGTGEQQNISSYKDTPCALGLKTAMAYSAGAGLKPVRTLLAELNDRIHAPLNHKVTLSLGNADGLTKCFRLLGDPGDFFLCEEFTFTHMTNAALPLGVNWIPIRMDKDGIIPTDMERILATWDEASRGKRPHVLYTVPCSQNPTGSTLTLERRLQIYRIAHDWDVIILEDDPYYLLQYDLDIQDSAVEKHGFIHALAEALPRSFLSMDRDGRVIRLDSFSKIIAPGMRLGWVSSNQFFAERLDILTDASTQHPHGLGQAFVAELLGSQGWGPEGYLKWALSLSREYERRRNLFIHVFEREVAITGFVSVEVPRSGMFAWIQVHLDRHPRYKVFEDRDISEGPVSNTAELMDEFFRKLLDCGLIMMPAPIFAIVDHTGPASPEGFIADRSNYLRAAFVGTDETIENGLGIFARGLEEFFGA